MRKIIFFALFIAFFFIAAEIWPVRKYQGEPDMRSVVLPAAIGDFVNHWGAYRCVYAFNAQGDTLFPGQVVIWNNTKTLVDSAQRASACDTLTLVDTLTDGLWYNLRFKGLNALANCSLDIAGYDTVNAAQTESGLVINGNAGVIKYSSYKWKRISRIIWRNGAANDTLVTYGVPFFSVCRTTTAANAAVAGVVADTCLDSLQAKIIVRGITQAYVRGGETEVIPGMYLETTDSTGYARVNATPAAGKSLGKVLEAGNTPKLYWVHVNTGN